MSETPNVGVDVDPNIKSVRAYENGLPVHRRMKKPILCQNKGNTYTYVPEDIAREKIKEGLLVELHPWDEDYLKGVKLAMGVWDGFKPGEMVQVFGQPMRVEDLGKLNINKVMELAKAEVEKYQADKKSGLLKATEMPPAIESFSGKKTRNRFAE